MVMVAVGDLVVNRNELMVSSERRSPSSPHVFGALPSTVNRIWQYPVSDVIPPNSPGIVIATSHGGINDMLVVLFRGHLMGLWESSLKVIRRVDE